MAMEASQQQRVHWQRTSSLTYFVLFIWFVFSLVVHWFAKELNEFTFIGFPLGYYLAVQGSLAVFVILIFYQNWRQDVIDRQTGFDEE